MDVEQRRIWSKIFDEIDKEREEQILLERKIIEEERERDTVEIPKNKRGSSRFQ